jgi:ABC-2 type transport system permease protein
MSVFITLVRRELSAFFFSMTGYVIIAGAAFLTGLSFVVLLTKLQGTATPLPITELFYSTPFFWLVVLLASPVITMRLFAQEKFTGTFETLMTTPVGDAQVVLAKFSAAWIFYMIMWLPLLASLLLLRRFAHDSTAGPLTGMFLGIGLVGALFMALGCLASALTRSQVIAAMGALASGMALFLMSFLGDKLDLTGGGWSALFNHLSLFDHMADFARGVVDTRAVTLYLTATGVLLFATQQAVASRRWK